MLLDFEQGQAQARVADFAGVQPPFIQRVLARA
jgi:hypothetical protein